MREEGEWNWERGGGGGEREDEGEGNYFLNCKVVRTCVERCIE